MSHTSGREDLEREIERLRQEVGELKAADAARHESEGRYQAVLEAAPDQGWPCIGCRGQHFDHQ